MTTKDEALKLALDALEFLKSNSPAVTEVQDDAIQACRAALAEQDSEPEWYHGVDEHGCNRFYHKTEVRPSRFSNELYTTPQTAPAVQPLTAPPMQPVIKDAHGVLRFKANALVDTLYEHGVKTGLGLNELACLKFSDEDRQQFAQLIGYSVSGYGDLRYVTDEAYSAAQKAALGIGEKK